MEPPETNGSQIVEGQRAFSSSQEGVLFGAISIGRIIGSYPAIKLHQLIGFKRSFTIFGMVSALATLSVPLLNGGFYVVLAVRIIQGIVMASSCLSIGYIPTDCGKANERSLFVSLMTCSMQLGSFLIMPTSGAFCSSSYGWRGAFYLTSAVTVVIFIVFFFTYSSNSGKPKNCQKQERVPYTAIITTPSFWGILIIAFGDTIAYHVFLQYGPIYINKVLDFDVATTGVLTAIPYLVCIATKAVGGVFLDRATCISEYLRIMLFTSLSQGATAMCFVVLTQINSNMALVGHLMLTFMTVFSGLAYIGLMSGTQIISQQFTYIVTSALAIQDSFAGFLVPMLVAAVAPNYATEEWRLVFYILISLLVASNVLFLVLPRIKPAKWTK